MKMLSEKILYYLIIINVLAFVLSTVLSLRRRSGKSVINMPVMLVVLLGGALGTLVPMLLWDRRANKENILLWISVICLPLMQLTLFILLKTTGVNELNFSFIDFFSGHRLLMYGLVGMNALSFSLFGIDKLQAIRKGRRIKIVTLFAVALLGGSAGAILGMLLFRHKIRKNYFVWGLPMILLAQILILFTIMNI